MKDVLYDFDLNYYYAKKYYEEHDNCLIPKSYKISINGKLIKVGKWCVYVRKLYKNKELSKERIEMLKKINFVFTQEDFLDNYVNDKWMRKYALASAYYEAHGNLLIPYDYVVTDENKNVVKLGEWLNKTKEDYLLGNLNSTQIKLLSGIGMSLEKARYLDDNDINKNKKF